MIYIVCRDYQYINIYIEINFKCAMEINRNKMPIANIQQNVRVTAYFLSKNTEEEESSFSMSMFGNIT